MRNLVGAEAPVKHKNKDDQIKLTYSQWAVYYCLISKSKYNGKVHEDHRYIYKKSFTLTGIGEELGITRQTVRTSLKKLEEVGLVVPNKDDPDFYLIYARNQVEIDLNVLLTLLSFAKLKKDKIDFLRIYLCLKRMNAVAKSKSDCSFTITDLMEILEHNITDDSIRDNLKDTLIWLQYLKLINFKTSQGYDPYKGPFVIYCLEGVATTTDHPEFNSSLAAEISAKVLPDRIKQQVKFQYVNFEENSK